MNVHFIAIGGAAMHNLALALHHKGHQVTGSDDQIFEPSRSRLAAQGLLPDAMGWNPDRIGPHLDAIILGMHAKKDNPELQKALEMGIPVYSYPEFIYKESEEKKRVVIGGSHGKTSITAMVLHVLHGLKLSTDYMVGAQLEGFDTMVQLTKANDTIVLEGDEYLSSPLDLRPKFHWYQGHIGLLSGIAWDHINVFPTYENYKKQFEIYLNGLKDVVVYCAEDAEVVDLVQQHGPKRKIPYGIPKHSIQDGMTILHTEVGDVPLEIFGPHNLMNLEGARLVLAEMGVSSADFYQQISSFKGAARRLEKVAQVEGRVAFKDFAHSPSKVKATTESVAKQFEDRTCIACLELHTFSSLNPEFLDHYLGALDAADHALVYFNPEAVKHKGLEALNTKQIAKAFGNRKHVVVCDDSSSLNSYLEKWATDRAVYLIMSSGNFNGLDINAWGEALVNQ